jgi:2-dehydro-3-deoxyphosphogluconate aldolase/(4S)-4-hydroxy-2-oxoglutarate aldolase
MAAVIDVLKQTRLMAIVQAPRREDLILRAVAAAKGGLTLLALPVSVPFVAEIAAEVADAADGVTVGLSDVLHSDHVSLALAAGAEFVLSPVFDPELIQTSRSRGIDIVPSVSTPNELYQASRIHDGPVAVVPAEGMGGVAYFGWLHRAFPAVELVAFGGIGSDRAPQYLERGAAAVVVDTGLFPAEMDPESAAVITMRASALVELCADAIVGQRQSQT